MTAAAILFATVGSEHGSAAAALKCGETTLLGRLLGQLSELGFTRAWVVTRPGWESDIHSATVEAGLDVTIRTSGTVAQDMRAVSEIASSAGQPLVIGSGDILTHKEALAGLLADPRIVSGILTTTGRVRGSWTFRTRAERGRIVSASSPYHKVRRPTGYFLGFIKVDPRDQGALASAADRFAELTETQWPERWDEAFDIKRRRWRRNLLRKRARQAARQEAQEPDSEHEEELDSEHEEDPVSEGEGEPIDLEHADEHPLDDEDERNLARRAAMAKSDPMPLILVGLIRSQVHLANSYLRELFWSRPLSAEAVEAASEKMHTYDEDRVLLDSAVKGSDGFFTTFFVSPYSKFIARFAARRGWTPNLVTTISMAMGIVAAVLFATGTRTGLISGAVMLQVAFSFDCVDGQLARYTRTFSKFGAWLDSIFDRAKEYVAYAGLAIGSVVGFGDSVWILAAAALALQTVRHTIDFSFASARQHVLASLPPLPLEQPEDKPLTEDEPDETADDTVTAGQERSASLALPVRIGRKAVRASRDLEQHSVSRWLKKIVVLPIGERFALVSVTAAVWNPQVTFIALLVWGSVALAYQITGRILRSMAA